MVVTSRLELGELPQQMNSSSLPVRGRTVIAMISWAATRQSESVHSSFLLIRAPINLPRYSPGPALACGSCRCAVTNRCRLQWDSKLGEVRHESSPPCSLHGALDDRPCVNRLLHDRRGG